MQDSLHSTTERILAGAGLGGFAIGCGIVTYFNPSATQIFPACPLLSMTGFACPGCGLTRGFHAFFHGDFLTALDFNAILPLYVIAFIYIALSLFLVVIRGRGLNFLKIAPTALTFFLVVSAVFGIVRNIPSYPFSVLYP